MANATRPATRKVSQPDRVKRPTAIKLGLMSAVALGVFVFSTAALAQEPEAEQAMAAGNAEQAISAWSNVLQSQPDSVKALVGRGTAYAWRQDWPRAEADIERALKLAPDDLSALNAAGYLYAWSGRHRLARQYFERMLVLAPDNESAIKGLAYNAYWAGQNEEAASTFEQVARNSPDDPEPLIGIGNARIAEGQARRSARAFKQAIALDPGNSEARGGLRRAHDYPAIAELSVWGGDTSGGGDTGIRLVELASWVTPKTRIWAKYDNGLSLDNPVLVRTGQDATTYYIGAQHQFGENVIGVAEFGYRDLPLGENQQVYKLEGVYLPDAGATKIGSRISPHSADLFRGASFVMRF